MNNRFLKSKLFSSSHSTIFILTIIIVFAISILDLTGWIFNIPWLKNLDEHWTPMRMITAICLALYAFALLAIRDKTPYKYSKIFAGITGIFICLVSAFTIGVYTTLLSTGIESPLANTPLLRLILSHDTRMALMTAIIFLTLGIVLLLLAKGSLKSANIAHGLIIPATVMSYFVPVSYFLDVHDLFNIDHFFVAPNTGYALTLLCLAVFFTRTDTWFMKIFTGNNSGSIMARRLLPGILILPIAIGWLRIYGEQEGYYKSEIGVILVALTYTVGFFFLVWLSARSVNLVDEKRRRSVEEKFLLEQRFSTTLASIGDAVIATDIEGNITFLNPVAEALTGWPLNEVFQKPVKDVFNIINESTRRQVECPIQKVLETGMQVGLANHTILVRKDGSEVFIDDSAAPIKDKKGNTLGVVLVFRDISERKRADKALRDSEQKFSVMFQGAPVAMSLASLTDGAIYDVNQAWLDLAGYTKKEEVIGLTSMELGLIPDTAQSERIMCEFVEHGKVRNVEMTLCRKSGPSCTVLVSVDTIEINGGKFMLSSNDDITNRKKAEELIIESEARLKRSQEIGHLGGWELDLINDELTWSDEIYRIFGLEPQEFGATYEAFLEAVHPEDRDAVNNAYSGSLEEGRDSYEIEHRVIQKNTGKVRYVHEKCTHLRNNEGKIVKSVGMVHDITERKIAEIALTHSEEQVRLKLESILSPEGDVEALELGDIINSVAIQEMMNHFYDLTRIPMAIIDDKGKVLVGVGWQDICTKFHRVHPETCKNCIESDLQLTAGIREGEYKLYKCANGMWDIATPIMVGGEHKGNLFMGQFFFENEPIEYSRFQSNVSKYGFNEKEYFAALEVVPRMNREKLESAKGFFLKLANKISRLSFSNIKLARYINESERISKELLKNNHRLDILSETAGSLLASQNPKMLIEQLCLRVMQFLDCQAFFNFIVEEGEERLHLNAYSGIPETTAKSIEWLDFGVAVCGCVARDGERVIAENIPETPDSRTELIKSFGIKAYCCHPLKSQGKVLGTLSFGTKTRIKFDAEEIAMMKAVADHVAIAMSRVKNEEAIRESEERFRTITETLPVFIGISSVKDATMLFCNSAYEDAFGYSKGELIGNKTPDTYFNPEERNVLNERLQEQRFVDNFEIKSKGSDGSTRWLATSVRLINFQGEQAYLGASIDITEQKDVEFERQVTIDLLRLINESKGVIDFIHLSTAFFQRQTGCEAVGIRLKEDEDYPYFETRGFSNEFVLSEKYLCARDRKGNILRDRDFNPVMECMCGNVICGRFDASKSFFTGFGSFWSNCTTELLRSTTEKDRQSRTRNRCNGEGYESVALIPLKLGGERIGLIQLNDKRTGMFTPELISLIERLSGHFTVALARFKAEEAIQKQEENLRQQAEMLEYAPVLVRNMNEKITIWNSGMEKLYGYTSIEALGKSAHDLLCTSFPIPLSDILIDLFDNNKWEGELVHRRKDGSTIEVLSLWILHKDNKGIPNAIIEVNNDISARRKRETELRHLNRVLNALGKSSQAMMHTNNEELYLEEVCRILVEDCGHSMVWIGYTRDDENKSVIPVAHAGFEEGYIEKLNISWADNDRGRGPTGKAIRTGKPAMCKNMLTDPAFEPWREEAVKRGYASSIVLPLILDGKPFGAISIYSKEQDPFTDEEVNLLSGIADDLSHGIRTIRLKESEINAIASLTESEEKYRMLFEGMMEGFAYQEIILDENGKACDYRFLSLNPAYEKHTGLKAENVLGKKASEVIPTLENYWINIYGEVALTGKSVEFENYNAELNSYFKVSAFSPKIGYFAVIIENITERTLAGKELYSTKTYLESLIDYANAPIIVWNPNLEIQLFNRAFERLTGYSSAEVEGNKLDILFPEATAREANAKIRNTINENWESIEIPILTKNKEERIVLWNSANIYDSDNKTLISTIAQGNDITERKKTEHKLKEAREKLDLALDNGNIGTFERDFRTNTLIWDYRMEKMFGYKEGTFEGTYEAFEKCLVEEDIPHTREASNRAVKENVPFETVYRIKLPNGNISHINAKGLVVRDSEENAIKLAGVCFDVTDMRKGAERILFKLNEELHRSNKELEQFAYVASHDLQEPLRMVSSFTQLLEKRYKDKLDDDARQFIHYAVDGATRMQGLINDLLNFSRIGTRGQRFTAVDFNQVLSRTITNLSISIQEKNANVTWDKMPVVTGDEGQLVQLMQNLVGNAIKFCETDPKVHIAVKEDTDRYILSVRDNGIGIEKQYFEKIFLIFQRLVPKDEYGGTGIGLAICKRIVERHGGNIWLESEAGSGTTFFFTLIKNNME